MKSNFFFLYYLVLILVLIFYTNTNGSPSILIRMGYLVALVGPLLNHIALYPAIVLCALCITKNTFAYPFMPTEMQYYVLLSVFFAVLALLKRKKGSSINALFIASFFYVFLNDILFQGKVSPLSTIFFLMLMFSICSENKLDTSEKFLPLVFVFLSLAISYWSLFCPEAQINTYNTLDDMEQIGWRDPNYMACALGTGLVVSVREILQTRKSIFYLLLLLSTIVLSSFSLLSIASRGMSVAVAVSIGSLIIVSKVSKRIKIVTIAGLLVFVAFLYTNQYFDFILARFYNDDGTGSNRTIIWEAKLSSFFEDGNILNYLFGYGQTDGFQLGAGSAYSLSGYSTHNDFISILVYYGFVGLFLFFSIVIHALRVSSRGMRPQIAALLLYPLACSLSIEPLSFGNIAYISFLFYITQIARHSRCD